MKKIIFLSISLFTLMNEMAFSIEYVEAPPSETIILILPDDSEKNWKEIAHDVTKTEGKIERIPLSQNINKWSELIGIQYFDISTKDERARNDIQFTLDTFKNEIFSHYPGKQVTWKIIEKTKKEVIYEWLLHKSNQITQPQHEIVRLILKNTDLHLIRFKKTNGVMSSEERQKWIKLLRDHTSIISFEEGIKSKGLSLVNKIKDSLSFEASFSDWIIIYTYSAGNGITFDIYAPPPQLGGDKIERLEIITMPNIQELSLDKFFERGKKLAQSQSQNNINIQILQKSQNELIYTYSLPKDHLQLNSVARTFLTDHGYYSINYKCNLEKLMSKEESLKWQEKLKKFQVKTEAL